MANTIPDIRLSKTAYTDLYAMTGIPKGTPITVQNKNTTAVYVQIKPTAPIPTSTDGYLLIQNETCMATDVGTSTVWAIGAGLISVQPMSIVG